MAALDSRPVEAPAPASRLRALRPTLSPFSALSWAVSIGFACLAAYPVIRILLSVVAPGGHLSDDVIRSALDQPKLGRMLLDTGIVIVSSSLLGLGIGGLLAWLSERTDARMPAVATVVPMLPFMVPPIAGAIGWTFLLSPGAGMLNHYIRVVFHSHATTGPLNIYSWYGMIFLYTIFQIPFAYLLIGNGLRNLSPALEEQSRISGAGVWRTFRRVSLPAVGPSLGAAMLLMIWFGSASYAVPAIIGPQSHIDILSVRIVNLLSFSYPPKTQAALGLSLVIIAVVGTAWYYQGKLLRRSAHAVIGGKANAPSIARLGRWRWLGRAVLLCYVLVTAVLPALAIAYIALRGFWTPTLELRRFTLTTFRHLFNDDPYAMSALKHSLILGVVGATLGMVIASLISLHVAHSGSRFARLIDAVCKFPAALSSIVVGIGFVLAFAGRPFFLNGSLTILLLAYLVLFMPQGSVVADSAAAQIGDELREASAVSGAGRGRTFLRINAPLMLPGLVAGWGFMFVWMVGELNASVLLVSANNRVVGFQLLDTFSQGAYGPLCALALILTVINVVAIGLVGVLARWRSGLSVSAPVR